MKKSFSLIMPIILILTGCQKPVATATEQKLPPGLSGSFNFRMAQGIRLFNLKDYDRALAEFNRALELNPDSAQAHDLLGIVYFMKKEYHKAEIQFEKTIARDPGYSEAYCNLGNVYLKRAAVPWRVQEKVVTNPQQEKWYDQAEQMFRKALEVAPAQAAYCFNLGNLLIARGRFSEGFSLLAKALELDPQFLEKNRGLTSDIALAGAPSGETYFEYAKLYAFKGDLQQTVHYLEKARNAGFRDWKRILSEKEFAGLRSDPQIQKFIK